MKLKELQYQIDEILNKNKIRRRMIAVMTAFSILIAFLVPYIAIKPGVSETRASSQYVFNFSEDTADTMYYEIHDIQGHVEDSTGKNWNWINTDYNNMTLTKGYSMHANNNSGNITFHSPANGKLKIVAAHANGAHE